MGTQTELHEFGCTGFHRVQHTVDVAAVIDMHKLVQGVSTISIYVMKFAL